MVVVSMSSFATLDCIPGVAVLGELAEIPTGSLIMAHDDSATDPDGANFCGSNPGAQGTGREDRVDDT